IGFQGGVFVVLSENSTFPNQQVRVAFSEVIPIKLFCARSRNALGNEKNICPGYGFVVELCLAVASSEFLKGGGEFFQSGEDLMAPQIGERQADVIGMM